MMYLEKTQLSRFSKRKKINIYLLIFIPLLYSGCSINNDKFFSYKINTYSVEKNSKRLITSSAVISYNQFLLEFKRKDNIEWESNSTGIIKTTIKYDTVGVYLMSSENKIYYEFDTFFVKNKVVRVGKRSEKKFGQHFSNNDSVKLDIGLYEKPLLKDTLINNIKCVYFKAIPKIKEVKDSFENKVFLIKNKYLNSINKIAGGIYSSKEYCIIGISIINRITNNGIIMEIEGFRKLTEGEEHICKTLIDKSKNCNIDTIKGLKEIDKKPVFIIN
jgi:hypothetical protein